MSKWEWKKLGEVCEIARGGSPRPIKEYITSDADGINWIKIGDTDPTGKYIFSTEEKIKPSGIKKSRYVESGDFLLSNSMSFGRPYILKTNGCIHDGWLVLKNYQKYLDVNFFYHLLSSPIAQEQFDQEAKGSTVRNLNTDIVSKVYVPIPPLSEQKRIVKFLDEEFSKIETLKTNAETNLKNAKELFETTLEKELNPLSLHSERSEKSSAELPSGWEWKALGDVCEILSDLINPTEEKYLNMYHIGGANIESETGRIIDLKTSEEEGLTSGKFVFDDSVVLYNKIRPYLKKVARPNFAGICSADMYPLSPKNGMLKDFLYYILIASDFTDYAIKHSDRAGMPKLNRKALFVYDFPLPPLSVQKEIVARLDKLSENVKRLEANYKQIIANCDELKKSILKKTFEGES